MYDWIQQIPFFIMSSIDYNMSNFTTGGIFRYGFDPYYSIFGNFTWGIILGFIGTAIYANERSIGTVMLYLLTVGVFFGIIFPVAIMFIFGLLFTFLVTITLYETFVKKK